MPYADPAKKKAYQREYNRKWYAENKDNRQLVGRAVANKRALRMKKKEWLTNQLENLSQDTGLSVKELLNVAYTDTSMRKYWGTTINPDATKNQKSVMDYTWDELKNYIAQLRNAVQQPTQ